MLPTKFSILSTSILGSVLLLSSCGLNTGEAIDFDNPFCYEYEAFFSLPSSATSSTQLIEVNNVIRDEYVLREISIKDVEKDEIKSIELLAPDGTVFYFPEPGSSTARVFDETLTPTGIIYSASNIKSEASGSAPVEYCETHLGLWELTIQYLYSDLPSDAVDDGFIKKTYEVCFLFDE